MYCSVYYIEKIVLLPPKNRAVNSNGVMRFMIIDTCEIIDFISGEKFGNKPLYLYIINRHIQFIFYMIASRNWSELLKLISFAHNFI